MAKREGGGVEVRRKKGFLCCDVYVGNLN